MKGCWLPLSVQANVVDKRCCYSIFFFFSKGAKAGLRELRDLPRSPGSEVVMLKAHAWSVSSRGPPPGHATACLCQGWVCTQRPPRSGELLAGLFIIHNGAGAHMLRWQGRAYFPTSGEAVDE